MNSYPQTQILDLDDTPCFCDVCRIKAYRTGRKIIYSNDENFSSLKLSKAKLLLKKKRYQEQTLERTDNQLENLEKMVCFLFRFIAIYVE